MRKVLPIAYSPEAVDELARYVLAIQVQNSQVGRHTIVCITGGSSTGKSTQVAADLLRRLQPMAQLISQDSFQLGVAYVNPDPVYRWDAPANYGLPESAGLLRLLQAGQPAEIPVYSFRDYKRTGFNTLHPTPIVLFEGLYAGFGALRSVADLVVYVESPLYARMLRRVFRSCFERYRADPTMALKSFLTGGVLKAHHDLVQQQREAADVIFRMPYTFVDTIQRFGLEKLHRPLATDDVRFSFAVDSQSELRIEADTGGNLQLSLLHKNDLYFSFPVDEETASLLAQADMMAY